MTMGQPAEELIVALTLQVADLQRKIDSAMNQAERRVQSAGKNIERYMRSSVQASTAILQTLSLAITASGIGLTALGGMAINLAMKMEQAKIAFTAFLGDAGKAQAFIEELQEFGARTPFNFIGLQKAAQSLMAFGFEAKSIVPVMTAIGGAVSRVGGGEETINRVTRALTQMLSTGRLSAEEMNQMADAGIQAWPMLAEKMGKSIQEVRKMAEQGQISGAQAVQTLLEGMAVGAEEFLQAQAKTMTGIMSNARDNMEVTLAIIGQQIIDTFDLKGKLQGAVDAMSEFTDLLKDKGLKGALAEIFPPETHLVIIAIAGAIFGALVPALIALAGAIVGVTVLLAPWMLLFSALAALAYVTRDAWMPIAQDLLPKLGQAFQWLGDQVTQWTQKIGHEFDAMGRNIRATQAFILKTLADIIDFLNPWIITIVHFWNIAAQKFRELGDWIQSVIQADIAPELNFLAQVATDVVNWIKDRLTDLANKFAEVSNIVIPIIQNIGGALIWLAGLIPVLGDVVRAVQGAANFINRIRGEAAEAQSELSNQMSNLTQEMRQSALEADYLAKTVGQELRPELADTAEDAEKMRLIMEKANEEMAKTADTFSGQYVPAAAMAQGATDKLGKSAKGAKEKVEELKTALEDLSISAGMMRDAMELAGIDTDRQTMALINLGVAAVDAGPLLEGLNVTVDKLALAFQRAGLSAADMQRTLDAIAAKQAAAAQEKADREREAVEREAEAARKEQERLDKEAEDKRIAEQKEAERREVTGAELGKQAYPTTDPIQKFRESILRDEDQYLNAEAQAMFDDWVRQFTEFGRDAGIILDRIFKSGTLGDPASVAEIQKLFDAWALLPPELQDGLDEAKKLLLEMIKEFNLNLDGTVDLAKRQKEAMIKIWDEETENRKDAAEAVLRLWQENQQKIVDDSIKMWKEAEEAAEALRTTERLMAEARIKVAEKEAAQQRAAKMARMDLQDRLVKAMGVVKQFKDFLTGGIQDTSLYQAIAKNFNLHPAQLINLLAQNMTISPELFSAVANPQGFATGGFVNASMGTPIPAMLHGQERVLSAGQNKNIESLLAGILAATKAGHVINADSREIGRTASVNIRQRSSNSARFGS